MQKILKNWAFTLSICLLLVLVSVLMFLDGFEILTLHIGSRLLNLLFGVSLAAYALAVVFPGVVRYRGVLQGFVIGELLVLLAMAVVQFFTTWAFIPFLSEWKLGAIVGLAAWMRGVTQIIHAYVSNAEGMAKARVPFWRLLVFIAVGSVGVWQMAKPGISDADFVFVIALAAAVLGAFFALLTLMNYRATADVRAAKKQEKLARMAAEADQQEQKEATSSEETAMEVVAEKKEEPASSEEKGWDTI